MKVERNGVTLWKSPVTYLYNLGNECTALTGGYTARAWRNILTQTAHAPVITRNDTNIVFQQGVGDGYRGAVAANMRIDFTNFSKISFSVMEGNPEAFVSITSKAGDGFNVGSARVFGSNLDEYPVPHVFTFDISAISGSYYLIFGLCSFENTIRGKLKFDKIWLE